MIQCMCAEILSLIGGTVVERFVLSTLKQRYMRSTVSGAKGIYIHYRRLAFLMFCV